MGEKNNQLRKNINKIDTPSTVNLPACRHGRQPSTILAIDTSTQALVVAIGCLGDGDSPSRIGEGLSPFNGSNVQILGSYFALVGRKHLELSVATVKEIINQVGVRPQDLKAIAVGLGPGSLIGSRIGLMVAKTLAQVLKVPIIGISTLDVIAAGPAKKIGKERYPTPEGLIKMGFEHFRKKQFSSIYDLEPIYLRGPV